jgi:hypothetical protein
LENHKSAQKRLIELRDQVLWLESGHLVAWARLGDHLERVSQSTWEISTIRAWAPQQCNLRTPGRYQSHLGLFKCAFLGPTPETD